MAQRQSTEQEIIARCKRGDTRALGQLYEQHKDRVYAVALRLCQHPNDAEDVLQEVFVKVHKSIGTFRGDAAFTTWLHRMTINTTRTHMSRRRSTPLPAEPEPTTSPQSDPVARRRLLNAMAQLPEGYREVLVLHDIQGLRHKEIAEILQIQPGTSKSQLSKARKQMRRILNASHVSPTASADREEARS